MLHMLEVTVSWLHDVVEIFPEIDLVYIMGSGDLGLAIPLGMRIPFGNCIEQAVESCDIVWARDYWRVAGLGAQPVTAPFAKQDKPEEI